MKEEMRLAIDLHGYHLHMDHEIVLENRAFWFVNNTNLSLAMMQMRLIISMFVWNFDAEFAEIGQSEPYYKDAFMALRGPLPLKITPVKRNG